LVLECFISRGRRRIGINLNVFNKAVQDFLIALAADGELSRVVSG